jgi:hypothetical protein
MGKAVSPQTDVWGASFLSKVGVAGVAVLLTAPLPYSETTVPNYKISENFASHAPRTVGKGFMLPHSHDSLLTSDYSLENYSEVAAYVNEHGLREFIADLPQIVRSVFGAATMLHLSVYHDVEEGWKSLYVQIHSGNPVSQLIPLKRVLFSRLQQNDSYLPLLKYLTISSG